MVDNFDVHVRLSECTVRELRAVTQSKKIVVVEADTKIGGWGVSQTGKS